MGFIDTYLAKFFPNKNDTQKKLVNYTSNLLKLRGYCSELGFQIWSLLIERTISIDVELQNELDELDDDELENADLEDDEDPEDEELGDDDDSDEDNDNEGAKSGLTDINQSDDEDMDVIEGMDGAEEYNVELTQGIKELSTKLDAILTLVSSHVEGTSNARKLRKW